MQANRQSQDINNNGKGDSHQNCLCYSSSHLVALTLRFPAQAQRQIKPSHR